mmetsp:Transcript_22948/g.36062  ORF Transcript_22948/g.36062 Transcript_22948/m.36062 type:complete len:191 (+) Transcript_22948:607-1179(+)
MLCIFMFMHSCIFSFSPPYFKLLDLLQPAIEMAGLLDFGLHGLMCLPPFWGWPSWPYALWTPFGSELCKWPSMTGLAAWCPLQALGERACLGACLGSMFPCFVDCCVRDWMLCAVCDHVPYLCDARCVQGFVMPALCKAFDASCVQGFVMLCAVCGRVPYLCDACCVQGFDAGFVQGGVIPAVCKAVRVG